MSDSAALAATDDAPRRLTIYYVCALSLVALLSIAGQVLVQQQLGRQWSDSKVVNLAGRQRMLSQRACKCAMMSAHAENAAARARYQEELRSFLPTWDRTHRGLQKGDVEAGLPDEPSPAVAAIFERVNPTFTTMFAAAERAASATDAQAAATAANDLLAHEQDFLRGMDEIVSQYELEGRLRVERLQTIERVLLAVTLFVLLLEGLLVFRPAARRIRDSFVALRRSREELQEAKEAAESASRAKSQFLANISHELRTPLHAVLAATELLRTSSDAGDDHYLEMIEDSGQTLLCLLNDLLDLSRIEAGKLELHASTFELRDFLRRTVSMFRATADAKKLELRLVVADDVPSLFAADQLRLRQVLANLLGNAVKFTENGSVTLRVNRRDAETAPALQFEVDDTGMGIPPSDQARIFESFTQVHDDRRHGGAGLGLAISAQLTTLLGGQLTVRSELKCGSSFSFTLNSNAEAEISSVESKPTAAATETSLRILAADDSPLIRRLLTDLLSRDGHRPCCVADGSEAVAEFERGDYDLVLLDLRMPELDGIAAAAALRAVEQRHGKSRTPIILLSADSPAVAEVLRLGDIDDCLPKPFSGDHLRSVLARHFSSAPGAANTSASNVEPAVTASRRERVLERLQGRDALLNELVGLFLQQSPHLLSELQSACDAQDLRRLRTGAHLLRGQLELLEVADAAKLARNVEHNCESGAWQEAGVSLSSLEKAWPHMCSEVAVLTKAI